MDELWAQRSASFDAAAREYAEHRPDYAADAISWALTSGAADAHDVLDLGAGTLTAGLVAAGARVTAVEPWEEARFPHAHRRTADSLTATVATQSHTLVVSAQERTETLARVRASLAAHP